MNAEGDEGESCSTLSSTKKPKPYEFLEIHASFQHYYCQSYAKAVLQNISLSSSCIYCSGSCHKLVEKTMSASHSAPSSPKKCQDIQKSSTLPAGIQGNVFDSPSKKGSTSSITSLFKKLSPKLKRSSQKPKDKPWIVVEFSQNDIDGPASDTTSCGSDHSIELAIKSKEQYMTQMKGQESPSVGSKAQYRHSMPNASEYFAKNISSGFSVSDEMTKTRYSKSSFSSLCSSPREKKHVRRKSDISDSSFLAKLSPHKSFQDIRSFLKHCSSKNCKENTSHLSLSNKKKQEDTHKKNWNSNKAQRNVSQLMMEKGATSDKVELQKVKIISGSQAQIPLVLTTVYPPDKNTLEEKRHSIHPPFNLNVETLEHHSLSTSLQPRKVQPPQTLNLHNKISISSPKAEKVNRKMTSAESIGSCSLDVEATGSESSGTFEALDVNISDRSLKSVNATLEQDEQDRAVQNLLDITSGDHARVYSKDHDNGHSPDTGDDLTSTPYKLPSYLGISCAISGYTNYSRFCRSRDNSPARLGVVEFGSLDLKHSPSENMAIANGTVSTTPKSGKTSASSISPRLDYFKSFTTEQISVSSELNSKTLSYEQVIKDSSSVISESKHTNGTSETAINSDSDSQFPTQANGDVKESIRKQKSLVQQRIESLYGQNVAAGWRASRCRTRTHESSNSVNVSVVSNGVHMTVGEKRSPSCPPQTRGRSKSPPVFKHLTKDFKEQLREIKNGDVDGSPSNILKTTVWHEKHITTDATTVSPAPKEENETPKQAETIKEEPDKLETTETVERLKPVLPPKPASLSTPSSPVNNTTTLTTSSKTSEQGEKDGHWYLACLDKETEHINSRISAADEELKDPSVPDEACGLIRAAIGKANLLVSKKFKQFRELCTRNINPDTGGDELIPKVSDLEGFWDMVLLQVADINDSFDKIAVLKANGWKEVTAEKKSSAVSKKTRSSLKPGVSRSTPTTPLRSVKKSETAMAREEARRMLREAKRKGRQQALQKETTEASDVAIFLPDEKKDA